MNIRRFRLILVSIFALANIFVWSLVTFCSSSTLRVSFLDVGQGDAILIRAPFGRTVLIDGGPGKVVLPELASALPYLVHTVDLIIESHPDTDHVGGLPDVAEKYSVSGVLKPCLETDNSYDLALSEIARARSVPEICAEPGQVIDLGGGAKLEILYAGAGERSDTNGASVVARLTYGETAFLFVGDTTVKAEKYLEYIAPEKLAADVYKVSHHGSRESNEESFVKLVKPKFSVISVGADNRYGHPHDEVLTLLEKYKSVILRTDELGTIEIESDGEVIRVNGK